jgi:predicted outer membrane repeat protein
MAIAWGTGEAPSDVTVLRCRFEGNTALGAGGGATVWQWCTARFEQCLFLGNTAVAQSGGALRVGDNQVTVQSCRFEGNSAGTEGGAIYCAYWSGPLAHLDLLDCTLVGNTAGVAGGGVHVLAGFDLYGWNTDFAGNTAPAGQDGSILPGGTATLACCVTSTELWAGTLTQDNSTCTVPNEHVTWGEVKALFR